MSLSDQIADMEAELEQLRDDYRNAEIELNDARNYATDLEDDLEEANAFIAYVEKTHPELRTAYEAAKKLEGEK